MNSHDIESICETAKEVIYSILITALCVLILVGFYLLIESPSKEERMADKGYIYVYSRRGNTGMYIPANCTEFKETVIEVLK